MKIMRDILITQKKPSLNIGPGYTFLEKFLPDDHIKITLDKKIDFLKHYKNISNTHLINAYAEAIPIRDLSLQTITTQGTFQVVHDQKQFLREILRILKPNGFFIITILYLSRTYTKATFKVCDTQNNLDELIEYINSLGLNVIEYKYLTLSGSWSNNIEKGFSLWIIGEKRGM